MALLDAFRKKKEVSGPTQQLAQPQEGFLPQVPVDQVVQMQQQGLTNNQIIQALQRQGFSPQQIYDAIAQAETQSPVEPFPQQESGEASQEAPAEQQGVDVESVVESVVEEKWQALQKDFVKINDWKDSMTSRMDKLEQSMSDLRSDLDGLHKAIVSRIGEYDKNLLDVGTEIKAMEKVFQKVLPELSSNVSELSRITKTVKGEKEERSRKR